MKMFSNSFFFLATRWPPTAQAMAGGQMAGQMGGQMAGQMGGQMAGQMDMMMAAGHMAAGKMDTLLTTVQPDLAAQMQQQQQPPVKTTLDDFNCDLQLEIDQSG